jgi:hypothetical protein
MDELNQLIRSFNREAAKVKPEGYILQGSVVRRSLQRRAGGESKTYGPYYLWTRKLSNKTVTQALTPKQAQIIREAIDRNRRLENQLAHLRSLSEQIIRAAIPSVQRRKRT